MRVFLSGTCQQRRGLLTSSLCCHAAFISASIPGPAHQPCVPRGRLKRGASSAAVESMALAMLGAMLLMQVSSGIGGSAATVAFATWHRRFAAINRLRSAVFGVSLVLSLSLRFGADLRGMRIFARDCDPIIAPLKGAGGHERSGSVDGPPALSRYSPNMLVPCCGWRFGTCRTRHFWRCKRENSEERG